MEPLPSVLVVASSRSRRDLHEERSPRVDEIVARGVVRGAALESEARQANGETRVESTRFLGDEPQREKNPKWRTHVAAKR